jgi:hypothetical protein
MHDLQDADDDSAAEPRRTKQRFRSNPRGKSRTPQEPKKRPGESKQNECKKERLYTHELIFERLEKWSNYSLRVNEPDAFGGCRYLNPPAIPFSGSSNARNGRGFHELGSGAS